jgi:hypothetical protein
MRSTSTDSSAEGSTDTNDSNILSTIASPADKFGGKCAYRAGEYSQDGYFLFESGNRQAKENDAAQVADINP